MERRPPAVGVGIAVAVNSDLRTRDWDRGGRPMAASAIQFRRRPPPPLPPPSPPPTPLLGIIGDVSLGRPTRIIIIPPCGGWRTSVVCRLFFSPRQQSLPSEEEAAHPTHPSDALSSSSSYGASIIAVIIPPLQRHVGKGGGAATPIRRRPPLPRQSFARTLSSSLAIASESRVALPLRVGRLRPRVIVLRLGCLEHDGQSPLGGRAPPPP
jgi:hypothetical protein